MPHGPYSRLQNKSEEHPGTPADAEQLNVVYEALEDTYTTDEVDSAVAEAGTKTGETAGQAVAGVALKHPTEPDTHVETAIGVKADGRWTDYSIGITEEQLIDRDNVPWVQGVDADTMLQVTPTPIPDSVHEWWVAPSAMYVPTSAPRTIVGGISSDGYVTVSEVNHDTGAIDRYELEQALRLGLPDDHNPPSVWAMDGHRTIATWTRHNETHNIHLRVSDADGSVASLADASTVEIDTNAITSYTELYRIAGLSDATQDTFWAFCRWDRYWWGYQPFSVNLSTGDVTPGTFVPVIRPVGYNHQFYAATCETEIGGQQVIRLAACTTPDMGEPQISYIEINCVTGAITSPFDGTLAANIDGTNLPVDHYGITPMVAGADGRVLGDPQSNPKLSRWVYAVNPDPGTYGVAYSEFTANTGANSGYVVAEDVGAGVVTHDLGATGASVGYSTVYFSGLAYPSPAGRTVIRAHSDGTTDTLDIVDLDTDEATVLHQQPTAEGRLMRPQRIHGGGPYACAVTNITAYDDDSYNEYEGEVWLVDPGTTVSLADTHGATQWELEQEINRLKRLLDQVGVVRES